MIDKLINSGYTFLNFDPSVKNKFKTYVVLGLGRSGTSMVAGTLHNMGINMGESLGHTYEDIELSNAFENKDFSLVKNLISTRNEDHQQWGWKRPSAVNYIEEVEDLFDDVIFLVVWRDIFAIANRNKISMEYDLLESMERSIKNYDKLLKFVMKTDKPLLLISYEKAMLKKDLFVNALSKIVPSGETLSNEALSFITVDPKDYLNASRVTEAKGTVGKFTNKEIMGWAFYSKLQEKAAVVTLQVNGKVLAKTKANKIREHLVKQHIHKTGLCGFSFNGIQDLNIKIGDKVIVMVENDIKELKNGKLTVRKDFFDE